MPKAKQPKEVIEQVAKEETLITPLAADSKELVGTSMEKVIYNPNPGAIPRGNPAIKGVDQNLGNGMKIKYN